MPDAKYERLPQAGDMEKQLGLEIVYLAPKPVPTGQAAINIQNTHRAVNDGVPGLCLWHGTKRVW